MEDELKHYGTPRHSGRYPWGSGKDPYQDNKSFYSHVVEMRQKGLTDKDIYQGLGMTSKEFRAKYSIAKDEKRLADASEAYRLIEKGYSVNAAAKRMGMNESSLRSLLDPSRQQRASATTATAKMLEDNVTKRGWIDIGSGVENYLGCSKTKLDTSVEMLKQKGYEVHNIKVEQLGTGNFTTVKVLCPPGTTWAEVQNNKDKIKGIQDWSNDGGVTWNAPEKPRSVSSDRIMVRYGDQGGKDKDGVIELRRGVADISLGDSKYAQVRIAVDDKKYLKGMAVYNDNMPKGVDIIFNTNKKDTGNKLDAMKDMNFTKDGKIDIDNPFGATVKQRKYTDKDGKEVLSSINIVNKEGDWETWKKTLSSQMLSKQEVPLAKKQLTIALESKRSEFDEIKSLTNPVVKKKLLESFSNDCDASAVHLEAAALPRQASHVILPLTSLKDTEIYAPRYKDGERVVLIRYPHGGKFEIPELTVNNRNKEGKTVITNTAKDAVGINSKVAERLSGADFDGDTVLVIPNPKGKYSVKTSSPLEGLKNFDPKEAYPLPKDAPKMSSKTKGTEMGKVSNLITDMTIKGATDDEIAAAVRHSMVVIDAEKHHLNYKQSAIDNRIAELKKKYQGSSQAGASTLISRASAETRVPTYREDIDPKTGAIIKTPRSNNTYIDKSGKEKTRVIESTRMLETDNAYNLVSGGSKSKTTMMEVVYAEHANALKKLANEARKEMVNTKDPKINKSAKETYSKEVDSLKSQLNIARMNAPKERQAQVIANVIVSAKKKENPNMDNDTISKERARSLDRARQRLGANKKAVMVKISDREWEAIQAGAISSTTLRDILNNTDEKRVRELATPRDKPAISSSKLARAKSMLASGCTQAEVADILGVSVSTLSKALK